MRARRLTRALMISCARLDLKPPALIYEEGQALACARAWPSSYVFKERACLDIGYLRASLMCSHSRT